MNCIYHGPVAKRRQEPLQIDLQQVMLTKLGSRRMKYIPGFVLRMVEKIICVPQINHILKVNYPKTGGEFAHGVLNTLNVKVNTHKENNLPPASQRKVMFVSNHPIGGVEGIAMIDFMHRYYGGQVYVMVNDILMALEPMQNVFVPVNKHGSQGHQTVERLEDALASDNPVLIFPAGWVSRLNSKGELHDYPWFKTFVTKAIEHQRTVCPVFCDGRNSKFFYLFARWRERIGIKLNIEMVQLPREVIRMSNKCMNIIFGKPIDWRLLRGGKDARETADRICRQVYALQP